MAGATPCQQAMEFPNFFAATKFVEMDFCYIAISPFTMRIQGRAPFRQLLRKMNNRIGMVLNKLSKFSLQQICKSHAANWISMSFIDFFI